jgi:hypothetical protein
MENYNSATVVKKGGSIITALADSPVDPMILADDVEQGAGEVNLKAVSQREAGDQINSFMLCTLVSKSAKRIKMQAEQQGVYLPMAIIVRRVLRAYLLAAKDKDGPLAISNPDINELGDLNKKILKTFMRQAKDQPPSLKESR